MSKLDEMLEYDIVPYKGIGDIYLGQSAVEVIGKIVDYDSYFNKGSLKITAIYPDIFIYKILDSIDLWIDIKISKLIRIVLYNNYKGKYNDVGLGDCLSLLKNKVENMFFDDDEVYVNDYNFVVIVDDDLYSLDEDKIENIKIEEMMLIYDSLENN
ncbi:hypothetical protein [Vibrio quintilis]|uniref:Uncharacterized protein n=1 Tax=Vibrio quintilis TaxID=1117707 RepID=A0A1M7Z2P6_9VIBR|nr:hypothetical protein [Vibrio quintilis]SHO59239.1 hypothetical protein VQ7734_05019 [Vibrio quintilis]